MWRMRIILGLLFTVLGFAQYWLWTYGWPESVCRILHHNTNKLFELQYLVQSFGFILMAAAACIIVFSFLRIDTMPNGELCYDPDNPYWRVMKWFWGISWNESVSLCKAYWLTVIMVFLAALTAVVVSIIGTGIYSACLNHTSLLLPGAIGLCSGVCMLILVYHIAAKYKWFAYFLITGGIGIAVYVIVYLPINKINSRTHSVGQAVVEYLTAWGCALGVSASIAGLVIAAFYFLPILRNTFLGRLLRALKAPFCPILHGCPLALENAEQAESAQ